MNWLMTLLTFNLIGMAANLDNSSVGAAYGAKRIRFPHRINAIVNTVGFVLALFGSFLGDTVTKFLSVWDTKIVSCTVLVGVGVYFIYDGYIHPRLFGNRNFQLTKAPGWRQGVVLGFALSFSNVVTGFGSSVLYSGSAWVISISIGVWGYLLLWVGNRLGIHLLAQWFGKYASLLAGTILILVGLLQVY